MTANVGSVETNLNSTKLSGPGGRVRSTWQLMKYPYETYAKWQLRYGNTFLVKALNGNVVATSNTENIRRILAAKHDEVSQFAIGTIKPLIGEHSVLIVNGQDHKRARNLLTPPFRGEALQQCSSVMQTIASRVVRDWKKGDRVNVMDVSLDYSLEVIVEVVFGVQDLDVVYEFKSVIKDYVKSFKPIFAFTRMFQNRWIPQWNYFLKQKRRFNELLEQQISIGKESQKDQGSILQMLLAARDEDGQPLRVDELKDHLVAMLFAGHETTQIAIGWAMSWLHRTPSVLERIRKEIQAASSIEDCLASELLHGVCQESLRLNPIVADFIRVFDAPIELEEISLPAGSTVAILTCLVHQDPTIYPDPQKFDPDRWSKRQFKPFEFLAFGGGVRRCIGATMALMEMKIALVTWLQEFEFDLPDDAPEIEPVHRRNLTMAPSSGIKLLIRKQS